MAKTKPAARDESRAALAAVIADRATAEKNLDDAHAAASKASDSFFEATRRLNKLRADLEETPPPESFLSDLAGGADVLELQRPTAQLRAEITAAEEQVAAWKRARNIAEQAIPLLEKAFDVAMRRVDEAVRGVVLIGVDIGALLADTERAAQDIIDRRAILLTLQGALPHDCDERRKIEGFLSRPWLLDEGYNAPRNPAIAPYAQAIESLKSDPDASLPAAP